MSASADDDRDMSSSADNFAASIADAVRAEMGRRGKSITAVASRAGVSRQTLSGRLNGHTPFTADELARIADYLGITAFDLFDSAALGRRFNESSPSPDEVARITPPQEDDWAQPARSKRRAS